MVRILFGVPRFQAKAFAFDGRMSTMLCFDCVKNQNFVAKEQSPAFLIQAAESGHT
jgi:hypothetical protein